MTLGSKLTRILVFVGMILPHTWIIAQDIHRPTRGEIPQVSELISAMNRDSIACHMQGLVNLGSRFMYAANRRLVAEYIESRFRAYGISNVALDSFMVMGDSVAADSVWQYNVIASIPGQIAPERIYLYGAHHDDYSSGDRYHFAPGADDNASGCAVAIEMARVIKLKGFQPASTIRLMTFAAEELVGYKKMSGSMHQAEKSAGLREDIRLAVSDDMVANSPYANRTLYGVYIKDTLCQWAGDLAESCINTYTNLTMVRGDYPTADGQPFLAKGYATTGFEEYGLSQYYHTINDSVSHCDMDFCLEAAKATMAILMTEQLLPVPRKLKCRPGKTHICLAWESVTGSLVSGLRLYRSISRDSGYSLIAELNKEADSFTDSTMPTGTVHYYQLRSVASAGTESAPSSPVRGFTMPFDRDLLVIRDASSGYLLPKDSAVDSFYARIFSDYSFDFSDASSAAKDSLDISVLGRYHKVFWLSNAFSNVAYSAFTQRRADVINYLQNGGNLFLANFLPTFLINSNIKTQAVFQPDENIRKLFKIRSVERKVSGALNGAFPALAGYDSIWIDSLKCKQDPKGHIINVECLTPDTLATIIYRFNSAYDTSGLGKMKGKPVGFEYMGNDYRLIIVSVPLYYLDSSDAKSLVSYVLNEKFAYPSGSDDPGPVQEKTAGIRIFPNPGNGLLTIEYEIPDMEEVTIEILDLNSRIIWSRREKITKVGTQRSTIELGHLGSGTYLLVIRGGVSRYVRKLLIF
jgi:hypothetical protein